MGTTDVLSLDHKMKYQELLDKIYLLRNHGKPVPLHLVLQAEKYGRLVRIPDEELKAILFTYEKAFVKTEKY